VMTANDTATAIAADLAALGVRRGGILLVHASLSSLGWVEGGAETVVLGLLRALGPEGTLAMPALSYDYVGARNPAFDVRLTPSCVGAIAEHWRLRPGTRRSVHPTHSICAAGPATSALLDDHVLDETPCGRHSPFRRLRDLGGQILFLGCGLRPNTSMHGVEEIVEAPYLWGDTITYRLTLEGGSVIKARHRHHGFAGWRQRYDRVADILAEGTELRVGPVLRATAHLLEAPALWSRAEAIMRRAPYHFVERFDETPPRIT
jgi:aminoglycoside 3-N-acetyltransferase